MSEVVKEAPVTHPDVKLAMDYTRKSRSAKDRGIDFTLTFTEFKNLNRQKKCFYTGVTLTKATNTGQLRNTDGTLDRVDHRKGYTKENTVMCCHAANYIKSLIEGEYQTLNSLSLEEKMRVMVKVITKTQEKLQES